jgi:hypothetical protein
MSAHTARGGSVLFVGAQERRRWLLEKTTVPRLVREADPETKLARATDFWLD